MIFVIGDIHGCLDPLHFLIYHIRRFCYYHKISARDMKLIFLGDYIDHGPSSRQVIDYIESLEFQKVLLLGNHEAMMMDLLTQNYIYQRFRNNWFQNGGKRAVVSFLPSSRTHQLSRFFESERRYEDSMAPEELPHELLRPKYMNFLKNLRPSHQEWVTCADGKKIRLLFTHALPVKEFDLSLQLSWQNYEEVYNFYEHSGSFISHSLIWSRSLPEKKIEDTIIVHGHTPTHCLVYECDKEKLGDYKKDCYGPFFYFDKKPVVDGSVPWGEVTFKNKSIDDVMAINIDTGSVYGHCLTAMLIEEPFVKEDKIRFFQVDSSAGYRLEREWRRLNYRFCGNDE